MEPGGADDEHKLAIYWNVDEEECTDKPEKAETAGTNPNKMDASEGGKRKRSASNSSLEEEQVKSSGSGSVKRQKQTQQDEDAEDIPNALNVEPISVTQAQTFLKFKNQPNSQTRDLLHQLPSSVSLVVENLQKSVQSNLEQIVSKLIEQVNSSAIGLEVKALKDENDILKKKVLELEEYKIKQEIKTEDDKNKALNELRTQLELEKNKAIEETKKKTWCAHCGREADLFCCWDVAYCGHSCQEKHWPTHGNSCSQAQQMLEDSDGVPPKRF